MDQASKAQPLFRKGDVCSFDNTAKLYEVIVPGNADDAQFRALPKYACANEAIRLKINKRLRQLWQPKT